MPAVNPISRAWKTASEGTSRTVRWAVGGSARSVAGAARRARDAVTGANQAAQEEPAADREGKAAPAGASVWERSGGAGIAEGVRSNRRSAAVWTGIGLLVAIWIGWAIYVWTSNGATAGIGVLISWPAVFAALALICAPFAGVALYRRGRAAGEPEGDEGIASKPAASSSPSSPAFIAGPPVRSATGSDAGSDEDG